MAKLKMLLKGGTNELLFDVLTSNDTLTIVDTDTSYGTVLNESTLNITTPPQLIFM